jgi:hypothetical protein
MEISLLQKNGERLEAAKDGGTILITEGRLDGNYREIQASFALHFHNGFVLISFFSYCCGRVYESGGGRCSMLEPNHELKFRQHNSSAMYYNLPHCLQEHRAFPFRLAISASALYAYISC